MVTAELFAGIIIGLLIGWAAGAVAVYFFLMGYVTRKVSEKSEAMTKKILRDNGYDIKE